MINYSGSEEVTVGNTARALKFMKVGRAAMELSQGRGISQNELAEYLGISPATLVNWFSCSTRLTQVEAALRILERLPISLRNELLAKVLRVFPTIESPAFAHLPTVVSRLRSLLEQRAGLAVIRGSDSLRTLLFTALGHSICEASPRHNSVQGIDIHTPDWFVPVPGISYVTRPVKGSQRHDLNSIRPRQMHAGVLMLNGVVSLMPEWQGRAFSLLNTQHVIIADEVDWKKELQKMGAKSNAPIHILDIDETDSGRISITIRSVDQL
jgi:transcriptional regulator with XRE-family HTH domain